MMRSAADSGGQKEEITETSRKWVFNDASDITTFLFACFGIFLLSGSLSENSRYVN